MIDGTTSQLSLAEQLLACPVCHARFRERDQRLTCTNPACHVAAPLVDGVVVLDDRADVSFQTSLLSTFPPAFSMPWFQFPRFIYPFDVNLYRWTP